MSEAKLRSVPGAPPGDTPGKAKPEARKANEKKWRKRVAIFGPIAVIFAALITAGPGYINAVKGGAETAPDRPPRRPPPELRLGGIYYMFGPSDQVLWQVVDPRDDPRLQQTDAAHPTGAWDPHTLWVDRQGYPVSNPEIPLSPAASEVARAFGTSERLSHFMRHKLTPVGS